jgi:RimJ/RimL family protein N-acetyltransferase
MEAAVLKNGQELIIRKAREYDAKQLVDMFNQMGGESENLTYGLDEYYLNEIQEKLFVKAMKDRSNSIFLVALIEEQLVGYITLSTIQKGRLTHRGELGVGVLKEYWGLGIATKLVQHLLDWAEAFTTVSKIELQVRQDNTRAIELYKKLGFFIEGKITMGVKINDNYYDLYYMGKTILR